MPNSLSNRDNNEAKKLLQWIKESVSSPRCVSLQDLGNGVVWCRLMAKLRPGSLASVLVINRPANVGDSLHNYTLLEAAFHKNNMLWNFDTRKLIAGNILELLRLAKRMARVHSTTDNQLMQNKNSLQSLSLDRPTRYPAGELEPQQNLTDERGSKTVCPDAPLGVAAPLATEQTMPIIVSKEQQLRQRIQTLFSTQQLAVEAFMANHGTEALTAEIAAANCFCKKCSAQVNN